MQRYNIVKDGGNKKDKNRNLYILCLKFTKDGSYKDKWKKTKQRKWQQKRQRINYL